jgi:outer membrane protein OmpA-like peptidoglycan-associated protein
MRRFWLLSSLLALLAAPPAFAQIAGTPFELSGSAGVMAPDTRAHVLPGPDYQATLGYRWQPWLVTEGYGVWAPGKADSFPGGKVNFFTGGLDLRFNLRPGDSKVVPFVAMGGGYAASHGDGLDPAKLERGSASIGGGVLFNLFGNSRRYLRVQVRDILFRDRGITEFSNNVTATIGLHLILGGKVKDTDLDGVRDWIDECPLTPIGAKVDPKGCPIDSDRDSVYDGLDKCPNTPIGAKVDKNGCPLDADGDGVPDGIDQCPDTPKGATVDAKGCPNDADGDGVLDGIDQCPNTPKGARVDAKGCPMDSDGDGVLDGLDKCPDTPKGLKVDEYGCPVEMIERETELLDTGMIRLNNVNFATGKDSILADSYGTLDAVGALLAKWPQLKMEISGHTDNTGSAKTNKKLSLARAQAVQNYILSHHSELKADQYTVAGYGSSKPVATNKTPEGKAQNRRVEFQVLNKDVLRQEIEKRTPVPADSSKK